MAAVVYQALPRQLCGRRGERTLQRIANDLRNAGPSTIRLALERFHQLICKCHSCAFHTRILYAIKSQFKRNRGLAVAVNLLQLRALPNPVGANSDSRFIPGFESRSDTAPTAASGRCWALVGANSDSRYSPALDRGRIPLPQNHKQPAVGVNSDSRFIPALSRRRIPLPRSYRACGALGHAMIPGAFRLPSLRALNQNAFPSSRASCPSWLSAFNR